MKLYAFVVSLALLGLTPMVQAADGETAKVCVDVKDAKGQPVKDAKGNVKQNCKTMKVHKKLEGTEVPAKK